MRFFRNSAKVVVAGKWYGYWLDLMGKINSTYVIGFAMFWHHVIVREEHKADEKLIAHELVHIRQMKDGWYIPMMLGYLYYNIIRGYRKNPYEMEAREIAADPVKRKEILEQFNIKL